MTSWFIFDISESFSKISTKSQNWEWRGEEQIHCLLLCLSLYLFSKNGWSDNNYWLESCNWNLNLKIRFVLMENNGLSTCGYIDFCPEDCQVEIFFFLKSSICLTLHPIIQSYSAYFPESGAAEMKMPQLSARMKSKINTNCDSWGGSRGVNLALPPCKRLHFSERFLMLG